MGNCAGYCISDNPENKKKITVERQGVDDNVAYINENN